MWIDALASRSGPLLDAATQFTAKNGLERDPPRGVEGLTVLSRLIRRAQGRVRDDDDGARAFLEGAGAYLALLLLDHFGDARHTSHAGLHRLTLGECGTFDPFAAVEQALDSDDIRHALLTQLRLAESEAEGATPTARVVAEVRRALADLEGVHHIEHFDRTLWIELDGTRVELDLRRVVEVTRGESDLLLRAAVGRLCASLRGETRRTEQPWELARAMIYPRLVGSGFVEALPGAHADLHLQRLGSEVWETLVLRTKDRARYVRREEVADWSRDGASPRAQALQNLAQASERARFLQHDTKYGPIVVAQSRDGLDAARLLLPGLHAMLAGPLGSPFLVAVPHRDALLACPTGPVSLVEELTRRVQAAARQAPHAISARIWLVKGPGEVMDSGAE